jgi:hypothetical protein
MTKRRLWACGATAAALLLLTERASGARTTKAPASNPITEIRVLCRATGLGIEREVIFRPDDTARVDLKSGHSARGHRTERGRLAHGTFSELASLLESASFQDLDDEYAVRLLHRTLYVITVKYRHGKKTVRDYGQAGPLTLVKFETTAEELLESSAFK